MFSAYTKTYTHNHKYHLSHPRRRAFALCLKASETILVEKANKTTNQTVRCGRKSEANTTESTRERDTENEEKAV